MSEEKAPQEPKAIDLKTIVDATVAGLKKAVGERGSVIVMVSAPTGPNDAYYVCWSGPLLTAKGLREEGYKTLEGLFTQPPTPTLALVPKV